MRYLSCAETAKLLRMALRESFPGVKFSVRSKTYSGGASISVHYVDGPATKLVEAVADQFSGAYFDGMIDYKGYKRHRLDGELVSLGADFIFVRRDLSAGPIATLTRRLLARYGETCSLSDDEIFELHRMGRTSELLAGRNFHDREAFDRGRWQAIGKWSDRLNIAPSATLKRLSFAGDEGYGQGTVGPDFDVRLRREAFQVIEGGRS